MSLRARVHAGDPDAFRELFDEHVRSVYNHAYRLTGNWSTAEDVASLTFLEAWRLRARVDLTMADGSLRPWLLGIATNVARNVRRAARRHEEALGRMPAAGDVPDHADEVAARLDDRARAAAAMAALGALRKPEREVLSLCVWSGLTYEEAAEALGVPIGTVRSRLSRARGRLARELGSRREPAPARGQVLDDRDPAVRLAQENAR
jgi:RNA polymerase sigma-70 factor (ECF subfamily)